MDIQGIYVHVDSIGPADVGLGKQVIPQVVARVLHIGEISFTLSATFGPESARRQAAVLTALSNAAIEAAHWLEDMAGDIENAARAS